MEKKMEKQKNMILMVYHLMENINMGKELKEKNILALNQYLTENIKMEKDGTDI